MIRLIASDMDGTLVNGAERVSSRCVAAIRSAQALGAEFIVTTGRSYEETAPHLREAGIVCSYLLMNGSELRNDGGDLLQSHYLSRDKVEICTRKLHNEGVYLELYTAKGVFSTSTEEQIHWAVATKISHFVPGVSLREAYERATPDFWERAKIKRLEVLDELWMRKEKVGKIVTFSSDLPKLGRLREEFAVGHGLNAASSFPINLELTDKHANKGQALKAYARSKGIALNDVMTVGDNYNDLSMLQPEFGYPVAVDNAPDDIKRAVKYTTASNEEDGVAIAIEKFLLHI